MPQGVQIARGEGIVEGAKQGSGKNSKISGHQTVREAIAHSHDEAARLVRHVLTEGPQRIRKTGIPKETQA
jgi:hypothetical protein